MNPKVGIFLPSLDGGGAERVFATLANQFVALGADVDMVLASARGPYVDALSRNVRVVDLGARRVLRSLPKLARYLSRECPDVMLSGLDHANLVALLASMTAGRSTRCVISIRSVPSAVYGSDTSVKSRVASLLMRSTYRFANAIIANSEYVACDLAKFIAMPRDRICVIYNPLNTAHIDALSRSDVDHPWFTSDIPLVLAIGSLAVLKDFPTLIRAFSAVRAKRDCRLMILGEGPDRPALESLISELQLQNDVHLPGFEKNPYAWLRRANVFVSSSLTEGCPNALMEALACGTAVVSTDCPGGAAEILEHGRWGKLVPVGSANLMAEAILNTLSDSATADVRTRALDFSLAAVARQYMDVLLPGNFTPRPEH